MDHLKSVQSKPNLKAKTQMENSYLKHLQNERVTVQHVQNTVIFNTEPTHQTFNESQNELIIDEDSEADLEIDEEQDLVISEDSIQEEPDTAYAGQVTQSQGSSNHQKNLSLLDNFAFQEDPKDKQPIQDVQAHPYAVPEPTYQFENNEDKFDLNQSYEDCFAEEFTPIPPMLDGRDYIPEDDDKDTSDFKIWYRRVKKQQWKIEEKKRIPWKSWKFRDFQNWYINALAFQSRIEDPKATPEFIKSLENTANKRFMFAEMERSQNRRKSHCGKGSISV